MLTLMIAVGIYFGGASAGPVTAPIHKVAPMDLPLPDPECKAMPRPDGSCPGGKKK